MQNVLQLIQTGLASRRIRTLSALVLIVCAALAITIPFAGQAFSIDGPQELDYARVQAEHPFAQAITDYDLFGIHYDHFLNTHPRFLSIYLGTVLRVTGGLSF